MIEKFFLEEAFNQAEKIFSRNLSSACFSPINLWDLLGYYDLKYKEKILEELLSLKLDYSTQYGLEDLRVFLAKYYWGHPHEFLITSGASEAIFLVFSTLKFKKVLVQQPIYQSLFQISKDSGAEIIEWHYEINADFQKNFENFKKLYRENPMIEAIVINNPNNPLGIVLEEGDLEEIVRFLSAEADKNRTPFPYLIFDEVFRDASLIPAPSIREVVAKLDEANFATKTLIISDISKSYSLQGLRIGWIYSSDPELLKNFSSTKNYLSLRNSILSEKIALYALKKSSEIISHNQLQLRKDIKEFFINYGKENPKSPFEILLSPEKIATPFAFLALKNSQIIEKLASEGIFLLDGSVFGNRYKGFSRIRISPEKGRMPIAA